jgi:D-alanyl-D-alanine carboxypeptidase
MSADSKMAGLLFLTDPNTGTPPWPQEQITKYADSMQRRHAQHAEEWRQVAQRLRAGERPARKRPR